MSTTWKAILKSDLIVCLVCPHYGVHYSLMYLYPEVICLYRYLCGNRCICTDLIFAVADAFFWDRCIRNLLFFKLADTFQPVCHVQLHLYLAFSMPCRYSLVKMCILNLLFLCFTDNPHQNFASSIPKIHYLRDLPQYPLRC